MTGYFVSNSSTAPAANASGWTTETSKPITAAGKYYVYAKDATGNVSAAGSSEGSGYITAYAISLSAENATLTVRYDSTSSTTGTAVTAGTTTGTSFVALHGTPIYISASKSGEGYTLSELKFGSTDILSSASGYTTSVSSSLTISAKAKRAEIGTATSIQYATAANCANTDAGVAVTLKDARDDKTYVIQKMSDGNCWMVQNLGIVGNTKLTSTYSNVSSDYTLPSSSTSEFSDSTVGKMNNGSHTNGSRISTGAYYNGVTATAGTYSTVENGNATSDICPKGWHLPTGDSSGEFQALYDAYGSVSAFQASDVWGVFLPGYYRNSSLINVNKYSYWWSRTAYSSTELYSLRQQNGNYINSQNYNERSYGFSVRCVMNQGNSKPVLDTTGYTEITANINNTNLGKGSFLLSGDTEWTGTLKASGPMILDKVTVTSVQPVKLETDGKLEVIINGGSFVGGLEIGPGVTVTVIDTVVGDMVVPEGAKIDLGENFVIGTVTGAGATNIASTELDLNGVTMTVSFDVTHLAGGLG